MTRRRRAAAAAPTADARRRRRPRRWLRRTGWTLLALVVAAVVAGIIWRDEVVAHGRAAIVLGELLDVPVLGPVVERTTDAPVVSEITLAGAPTTMAHPRGAGPFPAIMFITGADADGRHQRDVQALARGLARAGYVVYVPDLPGMRTGTLGERTIEGAVGAVDAAAARRESRDGQVALASVSAGASLALSVAAEEELGGKVSAVAGVAPFADIRGILMLATTGYYVTPDGTRQRYETAPWMRQALASSLLAGLEDAGAPRLLVEQLRSRSAQAKDPLEPFRNLPRGLLDPETRAVVDLLANRDPQRFDELYAALPESVSGPIERLSPLPRAGRLDMPVELASALRDKYFPLAESQAIVDAAPDARLTVTSTLDHAIPELSRRDLRDLGRFELFVMRFLRDAAARAE